MLAQLIAAELKDSGVYAFLDVDEDPELGPFPARLEREITSCDVVIVLLSEDTLNSPWVVREIEIAHKHGKTLVPVLQEDFSGTGAIAMSEPTRALLESAGVRVFDRSNQYVHEALRQIVRLVAASSDDTDRRSSGSHAEAARYRTALITELNNNLVLELYERKNYEDICITPLVEDHALQQRSPVPLSELLVRHRFAVVGEPGSGKTTALRKLCLDQLRSQPGSPLPVYVSLASFDPGSQQGGPDFGSFLDQEVRLLGGSSLADLNDAVDSGLLLALDGWDELHSAAAESAIRRYLSFSPHAAIITSRPEAQSTLPVSERVIMKPLTRGRIEEFLRLRLNSSELVQGLMRWLDRRPDLQQLAENPLNLSLLAILFQEEGEDLRRIKRTRLFESAFESILSQHHRIHGYDSLRSGSDLSRYELQMVLETVAYTMSAAGRRFFTVHEFDQLAASVLHAVPDKLSAMVSGTLGIIRDRRSGRLEFFHLWYQEFLASRRLLELAGNDAYELARHLDEPKLAALLPFAVGLQEEPSIAERLLQEVRIPDVFNYCRAVGEGQWTPEVMRTHIMRAINHAQGLNPKLPVRVELAPAIAQIGEQAIGSLWDIAADSTQGDYARRCAIEALAILPTDNGYQESLLVMLLKTDELGLLWHVVEQVGRLKVVAATEELFILLDHTDPIVVGDAMWALGEIRGAEEAPHPDDRLIEKLIACLRGDDAHRQGHALRTLGRLQVPSAIPYLLDHLSSPTAGYRWIVPEAAALIDGPGVTQVIDAALADDDQRVVAAGLVACTNVSVQLPDSTLETIRSLLTRTEWVNSVQQTLGNVAQQALNAESQRLRTSHSGQLLIARHCETEWSVQGRLQGSVDTSLSALGSAHARDLAEQMRGQAVTRVYSSPLLRARQTAQAYADVFGVSVTTVPGLRELDHGQWEGQLLSDLQLDASFERWLRNPGAWDIPGGAESALAAQQRAVEGLRTIWSTSQGEKVLVVAHKHLLALVMCALEVQPLSSFTAMIREDAQPIELTRANTDHLLASPLERPQTMADSQVNGE